MRIGTVVRNQTLSTAALREWPIADTR